MWKRPIAEMLPNVDVAPGPGVGLTLNAGRPNPFQASTTIQYSLPQRMPVRLVIYDIGGRAVRSLVDGVEDAGPRHVVWDGRDERGLRMGPGLYACRLEANGIALTRKMSLLD